ncbi:unnamed protein product, partial [Mesorhabditis belari]|uniref:EGF-like domain-containing protein n=1 Tax=Mesorhabditis belari TaxID=2138241 RepID=A0AAF3EHP5_9BILA
MEMVPFGSILAFALAKHNPTNLVDYDWKCQNDGVYIGGDVCNCKPYFYGIVCENRICMNGGHNYGNDPTQRCVCPPGFIGRHCEPRSCSGDGKTLRTFDPRDNSMRSVSYVLSWTNDIAKKAQGNPNDQVIHGICSVFDQGIAEVYIYIAPGVSSKRFEQKTDCDAFLKEILGKCSNNGICELTTIKGEYIQKAISESFSNSPVFIIGNTNLTTSEYQMENIVQLAISLGITINTLLFSPSGINDLSIYQTNGFKEYGELAEKTGGCYITSYDTKERKLIGKNNIAESLSSVFDLMTTRKPIFRDPSGSITLYSSDNIIYFHFTMSDLETLPDYTFQLISPSPSEMTWDQLENVLDTGFEKIYKYPFPDSAKDSKISVLLQKKNDSMTRLKIYGKPSFPLSVGVSTADQVDSSHPHAVPIKDLNGPSLLVSAGEGISLIQSNLMNNWIIESVSNSTRNFKCLYESVIGRVKQCENGTINWLLLTQNSIGSTGLVPLYCGDAIYESSNNLIHFKEENIDQMEIVMNAEKAQENFAFEEICQHGSLYKNACACNIGWIGASCDVPDCQNDGKVNAGGTCDCPNWTSGLFCEKILNSTCDPVNTFAEWRSQIGSLIFVIEESLDVQINVQSWIDSLKGMNRLALTNSFQASQIVLVTYSDLLVTARFASNDPRGIVRAFQDIQWIEKMNGEKQEEALITGLQLQTTDRSFLIWITSSFQNDSSSKSDIQKKLFKKISDQRADLRIYTTKQTKTHSLLNQFKSPTWLYIPTMTSKVFISTQSLTPIINPADSYILEEIDSSIFSINATDLGGNHLSITFTADLDATMCSYSIETLNVEQIAYGVTDELMKEADMGNSMMPNGDHWLNIRWSGIDEYRQYTFDANDV